jgi:NADH dehydrogenase
MNNHHVVIVGGGFAGVWAALDDALVIRPRLYEADLSGVRVPLSGVLSPVGVEQREASVVEIDHDRRGLTLAGRYPGELDYDQLVLCPGSTAQPPGDAAGIHCADSYEQAIALQRAVARMRRSDPDGQLSATVVGAGFTGIELAAELAGMLHGEATDTATAPEVTVSLIDQAPSVAPEFGPTARGLIEGALRSLDVSLKTGVRVAQLDAGGVTLASGERLDSDLTVWAGGPRASALNEQLGVELDAHGRLPLDRHMASAVENVWAAGDSASVSVDGRHVAMMSCQHATPQGCQAGHNAAAAHLAATTNRCI